MQHGRLNERVGTKICGIAGMCELHGAFRYMDDIKEMRPIVVPGHDVG